VSAGVPHGPVDADGALVLAVDVGSSAVKAGLFDAAARPVESSQARVPHSITSASDGTSEEDAESLARAVESAIDAVLASSPAIARRITAVAVDSMASTFLGLDARGNAVTPVYLYSDTRSGPDVLRLCSEIDEVGAYQRTGCPQHTSYLPGRVRWLARTRPDMTALVESWADVPTYLYRRWSGRSDIPCSHSIASWSGMLNRHTLDWDRDLLACLGLEKRRLPVLSSFSTPMAGLSAGFARRWPALASRQFFLGIGDGFAANIGAGCVRPGRVALTVGTTSAMRVVVPGTPERVPYGLWAYRQSPESTLLGGAFSEGGNLLLWAKDTLRLPGPEAWDAALSRLPPCAHGLTVLPFLAGERATGWSVSATGVIKGLRVSTTPLEVLQALMEAVALRFRLVSSLLMPELGPRPEIVALGGAIQGSEYWLQLMADALQLPVTVSAEPQDTLRGTAIIALKSSGAWETLDDFPALLGRTYEPLLGVADTYAAAAESQRSLYAGVIGEPRFG
jgi:gluconokinase